MVDRFFSPSLVPPQGDELSRLRLENMQLKAAMQNAPKHRGHVLERFGDKLLVSIAGGVAEIGIPPGHKVEIGDQIEMLGQTLGILSVIDAATSTGMIERVVRVIDDRYVEVTRGGTTGLVIRGRHARELEVGDRVILDNEGRVAYRKLPREDEAPAIESPGVDWSDIVGQDDAVAAMREAVEGPLLDPEGYARYGLRAPRGALLAGPPGVGKTLLARAVATAVASHHGGGLTADGFISIKGPEVLNKMVGESERAIRGLFERARAHKAKRGYPAVILLDEADALLMKRGSRAFEGMEKTIVPAFLAEMDGLTPSSAFVLAATNRPDMLDPAVTREGRLDLKITLRRPDQKACEATMERRLRGCPTSGGAPGYYAALAAEQMFSSRHALYMVHPVKGESRRVTLADLASGAMCDAVVTRAKGLAVRREREGGDPRGLTETDVGRAVDLIVAEQRALTHDTEIADMMGSTAIREVRKIGSEPSPLLIGHPGPDGMVTRAKVR